MKQFNKNRTPIKKHSGLQDTDDQIASNVNAFYLEDREYLKLSNFINKNYGIKLPPNKKNLLQCRLQKRLKALNFSSFKEYADYVFSSGGQTDEIDMMIDAVSTNKTDFFREPAHFEFLISEGLGSYLNSSARWPLKIWSAGCSTGEEPYSIAMSIKEFISNKNLPDFNILATDIADSVLQHAVTGIYHEDKSRVIPHLYKQKYMLRGKNEYQHYLRIADPIRNKIDFQKFNLLAPSFKMLGKFDIIFCRNVLIYFERAIQQRILQQFCQVLNTGGYLFLGHSESITGQSLPLQHVKPTIFIKTGTY